MNGGDPRHRALIAGCLATAMFAALPQSPARASSVDITSAVVRGDQVQLTLRVADLAAGANPATVDVRIGGARVAATATEASTTSQSTRTVVLVVDTSGSMAGFSLTAARSAASSFVRQLAPDVRVAVVGFADRPRLFVPATTERARAQRGLASLRAVGETTLYDGIALGLRAAGPSGTRQLVVLSDGADTRSTRTLAAITAMVTKSGATLDAIAFRTSDAQRSVLADVARAGDGHVVTAADVAGLASAFAAAVHSVQRVIVTAALPRGSSGDIVVQVIVGGRHDSSTLVTSTTLHIARVARATPPAARPSGSMAASHRQLRLGLAALAGGLFLLVLSLVAWARPLAAARRRTRVLGRYNLPGRSLRQPAKTAATATLAKRLIAAVGRVLQRSGQEKAVMLKLEQASLSLSAAEWAAVRAGVGLLAALFAAVLVRNLLVAILVGAVALFLLPRMWLSRRIRRRRAKFIAQLPDALQLIASSLSAGYSLPQALDSLVQQGVAPVSDEIGRALAENRLGIPVEDALDNVAIRVADRDFEWTVMAIRIQREVGGNLAEVLTTVSHTLRERANLRRQVKVLSAEGRLSALILMGLPILLGLFELAFRRTYMHPLYTSKLGVGMLVFAVASLTVGGAWMRKVVQVEA